MFIQTGGGLQLVTDITQYSTEDRQRIQLGYSFEVNNQGTAPSDTMVFFVNQMGYYQIPDTIDVTSLFFPQTDDIVTVEYIVTYKEKNSSGSVISGTSIQRTLVGQEQGVFDAYQYLGESIRSKYSFVATGDYYQQMEWWRGICIDVVPYAMVNIQYYNDVDYSTYEIGSTGVLHMLRDTPVQDMCFIGRRMRIVDADRQDFLEGWECVVNTTETGITTADIKHPKINTVYTINGKQQIYYINHEWYSVETMQDKEDSLLAAVPIEGTISYYGNVVRNSYN